METKEKFVKYNYIYVKGELRIGPLVNWHAGYWLVMNQTSILGLFSIGMGIQTEVFQLAQLQRADLLWPILDT